MAVFDGVEQILAPMVRASTLAMRLECMEYGADLVYTEETIAQKILECRRVMNPHFPDIVEYYCDRENGPAFRTCALEKKKLVFQLGVSSGALAQEAALHVCRDVSGIDINMGCPKNFSVKGGMGAALMQNPETASDILKSVRRVLPAHIAVSCKTRLFDDIDKSADFVKMLHASGAEAVAVHMRTRDDRPTTRARWDEFAQLKERIPSDIRLIANGDFFNRRQMKEFQSKVGATALMVARGAQWDPSIFSSQPLNRQEVVQRYMERSIAVGATYQTVKYNLAHMVTTISEVFGISSKEWNQRLSRSKNLEAIAALADVPYDRARWPVACHSVAYFKDEFRKALQVQTEPDSKQTEFASTQQTEFASKQTEFASKQTEPALPSLKRCELELEEPPAKTAKMEEERLE